MVQQQDNPAGTVAIPERRELRDEERREVMERFWEVVQTIGERNRDLDPELVMAEVTKAVEEVRQEQYELKLAVDQNSSPTAESLEQLALLSDPFGKEPEMSNARGKPVTVAPDSEIDEEDRSQQRLRESFWRAAERISERNRDLDPEAELPFITEIVEEVRRERYEREQAQAKDGC